VLLKFEDSLIIISLVPVAVVAHAEIYMSQDQAAKVIFPGLELKREEINLSDAQAKTIEKDSGESVRNRNLVVYRGPKKQAVFIDQVLGKHEFITFAVGISADGQVRGVEIIEYRETYGQQIRNPEWRKQFTGKTQNAALKLGKDVKNITGATLSSSHITGGVKRLLYTYGVINAAI
jgi:Na+-translocating ferredoxin:NAD+ oxidoreductase RnfG subunit